MFHAIRGWVRRAAFGACAGLLLAASAASAQSTGVIAFVGVNVVPMDSERVLMRHTVVIQGDRIIAVDPADEVTLPRGARTIDAEGKYLIPGLIDAQARLLSDAHISDEYLEDELAVVVANGITTMRHAAGRPQLMELRERIADEDLLAPTLFVSSPEIGSSRRPGEATAIVVETPFAAASAVRQFREAGYDFVALGYDTTADVYEGVVLTSRGSAMPLVGRVPAVVSLQRAIESGHNVIYLDGYLEALGPDPPAGVGGLSGTGVWESRNWQGIGDIDEGDIEDLARATADAEVWNIPLLAAMQSALGVPLPGGDAAVAAAREFVSAGVQAAVQRPGQWVGTPPDERALRRYFELRDRIVRDLHRAEARLMAGSGEPDRSAPYGFGLHAEMQSMVAAGLPPYAALRAATRGPAAFLSVRGGGGAEYATVDENAIRFTSSVGVETDFGRIDVGMRADVVLLAANPLDDIAHTRRIDGVVLRGRWLPRDELDRVLERAARSLGGATPGS